ncbi:MAG: hypothetical protein MI924_34010 [Chloroflexales bacterium]|nr:hypothetical protein [Chloroflexales bacterium]
MRVCRHPTRATEASAAAVQTADHVTCGWVSRGSTGAAPGSTGAAPAYARTSY